MPRNYQPSLRLQMHIIAVLIARYRTGIEAGLTPEQASLFAAFEAALIAFQSALGETPVSP